MARSLNPAAQARALAALVALMRREKPDLVHAHMPISGLLARAAARIAGVPRIAYTCHGFLFNQPGPAWRGALALRLERAAGRITDTYLTVSEEEAGDARRLGIHPAAVPVLNGRDPARFRPDPAARAALRAELGAAEGDCVVIAVSRLVRHKGFPELLAAMPQAPANCVLWVVGERLGLRPWRGPGAALRPCRRCARPAVVRLGYRRDVPA
jgi:glycosyltransferase involved in cell wall biosynthesis